MNLYDITEAYLALDSLEPSADIQYYLNGINDELESKLESITYVIKNYKGDIEALRAEEKRLAEKRRTLERKNKYLEDYMFENMKSINKNKVKAGVFDLKIQKNPESIKIINPELITEDYLRIKTDIDKSKIKKALKEGLEVEGAELIQTEGLRIK
nr:MAG TPA: resistance protein [Caudoviricetes sp.]